MKAIAKPTCKPVSQRAFPRFLPFWVILLIASMTVLRPANAQVPVDENMLTNGDLNLDGMFDMLDLIELGRSVFLNVSLPDEKVETCDVDGDRELTNYDLLVLSEALNTVQNTDLKMFGAIENAIQKDVDRGDDNVEIFLDLARFYRKEKRLDRSSRVLEMILEGLDTRHPLYEIITGLLTQIDDEEESRRLMEEAAQNQELFRAEDDLGGKVSLRRMVLKMQGNLSTMLKDNKYASNFNSKKAKSRLNAVMANMLHKLGKNQMVNATDFTKFKQDIRDVLEDPTNQVKALTPEQRNAILGEVDRSTDNMRDEVVRVRQEEEQRETIRRRQAQEAQAVQRSEEDQPFQERLDRREWRLDTQRDREDLRIDRKIVANAPKITPDTVSFVTANYDIEWDVSNVLGAKGVALEISHADRKFQNPRGAGIDEENQFFYSPNLLTGTAGKRGGNANNLEGVGTYQFRVVAFDADGQLMSRFSDIAELVVVFNNINTIANKPTAEPNEVSLDKPQYSIRWDVSNVEGAKYAAVEISKPDVEFSNPNGRKPDRDQFFFNPKLGAAKGRENTSVEGLPGVGAYLIRVGAMSLQGDFIGLWSEPETLIVKIEIPEEEPPEEEPAVVIPEAPEVSLMDTAAAISWDVSGISGVEGVMLEVSPVETDSANPSAESNSSYNQKFTGGRGSQTVNSRDLKGEGYFIARIAGLDETGSMLGLWSPPTELAVYESLASAQAHKQEDETAAALDSTTSETSTTYEEIDNRERKKLRVTKKTIVLYKDKSLSSQELTTLNQGDILFQLSSDDPWFEVSLPGKREKGWVMAYDVESIEE